jgi:hypothetical protein
LSSPTSSAVSRRALLAGAALLLVVPRARAATGIGEVEFVHQWANRIDASGEATGLYVDDPVHFDETVATVPQGALHMRFLDDSELRLGSDCRVRLDEFVYDPGQPAAGKMVAEVGKGIARFVTGKIKQRFQVRTPVASIGVRGTDFSVWVEDQRGGRTTIWVNEGSIVVTPAGGQAVEVAQDSTVLIEPGSGTVQQNAPRPPGDPGLSPRLRLRPNR